MKTKETGQEDVPDAARTEKPGKNNVNLPPETGGPSGPEPTRYGDWERKGRCIDF